MKEKKCIYCGKIIEGKSHTIKMKDGEEYYCCEGKCYDDMKEFVKKYSFRKTIIYFIVAALLIVNLFILGNNMQFKWMYLPMIGIGLAVALIPSMYVTNYFYERMGIKRTCNIIRGVGIAIMAIGVIFTIMM